MTILMNDKIESQDPYAVLGVARSAESDEIKRAYFRLVRAYPPEREPERFKEIRSAYERINTPQRRARTDLFLLQPPPDPPRRRTPSFDLAVQPTDIFDLALRLGAKPLLTHDDFRHPKLL